jgi:NADPH:quinone reductase-like Zn-dependent oxidoreductase
MKALVRDDYGTADVLKVEDVEAPIPGEDDVLVRVRAASVNTADLDQLAGRPRIARLGTGVGHPKARRLGLDMAGVVEAVGRNVSRFEPGDEVWADMFSNGTGAFAEYVCAREAAFRPKPAVLTFEQAATVPHSGLLALQALNARGGVRAGQHVLINGAGGCVGPFAIQIAKARGATVTGVDHADKLDMLQSLGADEVIDYTEDDFAKSGDRYDFILDIAARRTLFTHRRALAAGGVYVQVSRTLGGFLRAAIFGAVLGVGSDKKMGVFTWEANRERDLERLAAMIVDGDVRPLVDRTFPLSAAHEALRYQAEGRARGKLVIIP